MRDGGGAGYATSTQHKQQQQEEEDEEEHADMLQADVQPDMLQPAVDADMLQPAPTSHQGEQLEAMMSSHLPDAVQEGLDLVSAHLPSTLSEAVHEGISTLPGPVKEQQEWMVGQLRALPGGWHQVDVCTGHYHAHAAIIVRDRRFESQRRDLFEYIADHFVL
jgi:hypothetical protein